MARTLRISDITNAFMMSCSTIRWASVVIILTLLSHTAKGIDFYTAYQAPEFTTQELAILEPYGIVFKKLDQHSKPKTHNQEVLKLIQEHGNSWHQDLLKKVKRSDSEGAAFIRRMMGPVTLTTKNPKGFVQVKYHNNGIIAQWRIIKDALGHSSAAYFEHKIKVTTWNQKGKNLGTRKYEESGSTCCFTGKTPVLMADGSSKCIEQIKPGDQIISYNPELQQTATSIVEEVTQISHDNLVGLHFDGFTIRVTPDHPFYLKNKGWCAVDPKAAQVYLPEVNIQRIERNDTFIIKRGEQFTTVVLQDIQSIPGTYQTYTINKLDNGYTFLANSLVAGTEPLPLLYPISTSLGAPDKVHHPSNP